MTAIHNKPHCIVAERSLFPQLNIPGRKDPYNENYYLIYILCYAYQYIPL